MYTNVMQPYEEKTSNASKRSRCPCGKLVLDADIVPINDGDPLLLPFGILSIAAASVCPSILDDLPITEECVIARRHPLGVILKLRLGGRRSSISHRVGGNLDERNIPVSLSALAEWALSYHSRR
ncbi:hypothetical protein PENANT_c047G11186 [Penicillium antarcticum]|uniref:Uncharacterized protein n=1 Tax=Penicillium antarcticum TaxID=416450 RepID=A0A1V6PRE8_9EURO|nr:hypothetical protein PENANT_c047G11186 [Penicillium antarcticum]